MPRQRDSWASVPLGDLGLLGRGKSRHRPRNDPSLYGGNFPFVQTGDVTHSEYWLSSYSQTYSEKGLAQSKLWPTGTLCITIAANIAETAILSMDACFPDSVVGFIADPMKSDTSFIKYSLDCLKQRYKDISRGTTQDNLSLEKLNSILITVPPVDIQRQISSILRNYDDLIDVNQRRIVILEDMARRLFDEWFVRFRYPGHEAVPLVETELGMVPERWAPGTVAHMSSYISRGLAPKYDDLASSLVINQKCIRDQAVSLSPARKQSKPIPHSKIVMDGDILINSTGVGTLGRVAQIFSPPLNATVDTHVTIVRASERVDVHYFGLQLLQLQSHFERQGIGATGQTELSRAAIADCAITIPPSGLTRRFGEVVGPMRLQAELLRNQNNKLRAARDLLLPKLISGEIDIAAAEEPFVEAAE